MSSIHIMQYNVAYKQKEDGMESLNNHRNDLMNSMTKRTLPSFAFVGSGAPKSNFGRKAGASSATCDGGCGGQCLSGCKDECITVSK